MYIVVTETIAECDSRGAITWTSYESKEAFVKWYDARMRSWYRVVEEGVTEERAIELCSSSPAARAALFSMMREAQTLLR